MSNPRAKSVSKNSAERNAGNGSKRSDFERKVSELAAEIQLQMGAKVCAVQDKPSIGREQEDGKQTDARERWPHVARLLFREYEKYVSVKNAEQIFLLDFRHNSHLITAEMITEVKVWLSYA